MDDENRGWRRRTFLAIAGASVVALSGCAGESADAQTPAPAESTPAPTTRLTDTATPADETRTPAATKRLAAELADATFEGDYFDTHAHWQRGQNGLVSAYASQMDRYDIGATVLFSPSRAADTDYEGFLRTLTEPGVDFLPFMSAPPPGPDLPTALGSLYDDKGAAFWGVGEWKPQQRPAPDFDGSRLAPLWDLAAELDVPVMYHPFPAQEGQVEAALSAHSDTTFLLHGHQMMGYGQDRPGLGPTLPRLLSEYDNLYWTLDVATMTDGSLVRFRSAREFREWYESNADQYVRLFRPILADLLEAAPSKVMWGTDVAWEWNLQDDVFSRVIDFTERVLSGVPEKHHAAYKRENATELFGL